MGILGEICELLNTACLYCILQWPKTPRSIFFKKITALDTENSLAIWAILSYWKGCCHIPTQRVLGEFLTWHFIRTIFNNFIIKKLCFAHLNSVLSCFEYQQSSQSVRQRLLPKKLFIELGLQQLLQYNPCALLNHRKITP